MSFQFRTLDKSIDRTNFDCGISELNQFLQKQARQQQTKGFNRTFVLVNSDNPSKATGYYTLSMAEMSLNSLPETVLKKLPKHPVPVARIGRLAVDISFKEKGLGQMLLVDALKRVQSASLQIGVYAVVVDAKNEVAKRFYQKYGFTPFIDIKMSLFIPLASLPN
ncbi:GNAT family N-acetyltransferase [Marinicella gelatinilytica]|uniref:GNAT family N-acetyltransferase n=1 Tax=Marinicella gelatinilytica TaxID=2996017 RepID=UPI0022608197|nr:GNAT family N-acetyltransferase [Marinicella gelatinilytica]MCX7544485.1 GNAT family N-acetyltransferase [Marinicella gelatinilytica]